MLARISLVTVFMATLAAAPAHADVYKWVDQHGVTNYAGKPPADAKAVKKVDILAQRLSVYTPDAALVLAIASGSRGSDRILSDRVDSLERQLEAERRARQAAAAAGLQAAQAAYDRCVADRRVDCNGNNFQYPPAMVVTNPRRQTPFVPTVAVTGVSAGNVTDAIAAAGASVSRTPGAFSGSGFALRSASAARTGRGFNPR